MPDVIKLLPDSVANQIAAGEVIQRPSSVVKELMENAVDAGSEKIDVVIRDSGRTLIQVIDNGTGMSETDARLAFERHATSKITTANDLFKISTKGFRGEALASIAAVAMVELRTKREEDESGTLLEISASKVETQEPCSCSTGSNISVKNLFFNIPARRKFLKSDNTEMRHIINEFQKIVIAHPEIRFTLIHNDSEVYNLLRGSTRQRIISVFGRQINNDLIRLDTSTTLIVISGFIGKPENARRSFGEQFFFVNNRFMKHPYFHKAVIEAYQNLLPPEAIPSYFIFMEADPASIDINIHPTKTEIKFEDERAIWQILMASVREALGRFNIVPSLDFKGEGLVDIPVISSFRDIPEPPPITINPDYDPFAGDDRPSTQSRLIERFEREKTEGWEKLYGGHERDKEDSSRVFADRKFFQMKNKYIICPVKSGLMIIDQKRAHERVLFEQFLKNLENRLSLSQAQLFPVEVTLDPSDILILREIEDDLRLLGFAFEYRDENSISITGKPSGIGTDDPAMMIEILLEEFKRTKSDPAAGIREKVASAMAGASAIPYGKPLMKDEMEELFDALFLCKAPNYSPTGKPVINILTMDEIDRRLK